MEIHTTFLENVRRRSHRAPMLCGLLCVLWCLSCPLRLDAGQGPPAEPEARSVQGLPTQWAQLDFDPSPVPPPEFPEPPLPSPQEKTPAPAPTPPLPSTAAQGIAEGSVSQGQVSLNFDDADVYSVIQTVFANVLRCNYIIDPRVRGRVTFRSIAPMPREEVLPVMEVILRLNGIAIVEESGLYRIVPLGDAPREPAPVGFGRDPQAIKLSGKALLQVVPIRYLQSTEMVKLLTPFVSTSAVLVDVPKSNYLIVVDTDSNVKRLLKLIDLFDNEQQKEKRPQVFLYHVQNAKAKDMATLLQQIFLGAKPAADQAPARIAAGPPAQPQPPAPAQAARPSPAVQPAVATEAPQAVGEAIVSPNTKIIPDEVLNAVVIIATAEDYAIIKHAIDKIDIVPRQVLFEGVIARVTLTDNLSLGLAWSLKANLGILGTTIAFNPTELDATKAASKTGFTFWGVDPGGEVRAMIHALAKDQKSKVLAAPHILVADNREAKIQIGKQVPIVTSETYGSTTIAPQRTISYKDIGIILKVKPRIHEGGLVSVELYQEVSDYYTEKLGFNEDTIVLNKMDATSTLVAKDKQTIVIGGLIREDSSKSNDGIPFLNKIPILGYLFGSTKDNVERTEIIILLTPHVVKSMEEVEAVTGEYVDKISTIEGGKMQPFEPLKKYRKKEEGKDRHVDKRRGEPGAPVVEIPLQ